jgi:hypothetical protein
MPYFIDYQCVRLNNQTRIIAKPPKNKHIYQSEL